MQPHPCPTTSSEGEALGRLRSARDRRWGTAAFLLAYPLAVVLQRELLVEGVPGLLLTSGLSLALLLSVGPLGAPVIAAASIGTSLLVGDGLDVASVTASLVDAVVLALVALLLEARSRGGDALSPSSWIATALIAGIVGPVVLALGTTAVSLVTGGRAPSAAEAIALVLAHGIGILVVSPGVRTLARRQPLVVEGDEIVVLAGGVLTWALVAGVTLAVGGTTALVEAPAAAVPMLMTAFLAGTAVYTVAAAGLAVVVMTVLALVGVGELGLGPAQHLTWWVVAAGGLLLAAEGDRRRSNALKLGALFGHAVAASAEVSPSGRVLRVNRAFAAMLGWRPEELVDSDLLMLFATDEDGAPIETLIAGHRDEVRGLAEVRTRGGSTRQVRYTGRRLPDPGSGEGLLLVQLLDMTDEERRAVELQRSNEALERLGTRISHDLKQPLAAIAGYASTLRIQRERLDRETMDEMLDRLDLAARRVVDQLDTMVESARVGGGSPESVSLSSVVEAVRGLVDIELRVAHGAIRTSLKVDAVRTDGRGLQQVLLNLVTNSLKYHDRVLPPEVGISSRIRGGGVEITVTDNGPGIPSAHLETVFEPGRRLVPGAAAGRGMGLADSRRVIEDLGGWLRAEPSAAGARFVLWLPDEELEADAELVRAVLVDCGQRDAGFASSAGPVAPVRLEDGRIEVVGRTRSVSEGVSMTAALEPDVVVVDRWIGDGEGMTSLASLAAAHPVARLVVRTRDDAEEAVGHALYGGATRALDNGADSRAVVEAVVAAAG